MELGIDFKDLPEEEKEYWGSFTTNELTFAINRNGRHFRALTSMETKRRRLVTALNTQFPGNVRSRTIKAREYSTWR